MPFGIKASRSARTRPSSTPRHKALAMAFAVVAAPLALTLTAGHPGAAGAASSGPAAPAAAAPKVVYAEDFENLSAATTNSAPKLSAYTGGASTGSMAYTADAAWLNNCNGYVLDYNTTNPLTECAAGGGDDATAVKSIAKILGQFNGATDPNTNHAVTSYTSAGAQPAGVVLQTTKPIQLAANATGHFITFGVDIAGASCKTSAGKVQANHPAYEFNYLTSTGTAVPVFTSPIDPCTGSKSFANPDVKASDPQVYVGHFAANGSVLYNGSSLGIQLLNATATSNGNDSGFDNIKILDVTPQLTKSFDPAVIGTNGVSTATFTITNTSELAEKAGWSFADKLPSGVVIAAAPHAVTTCAAATIGATAGTSTVSVSSGRIASGAASCTVTVDVTSHQAGVYTNGSTNYTSIVGLVPPTGPAVLTVVDPKLEYKKVASEAVAHVGDVITYTITVTNNGAVDVPAASFSDDLAKLLMHSSFVANSAHADSGTVAFTSPTLTWSGPLAVGKTATVTYKVTVGADASTSAVSLANTVVDTTPSLGSNCESGSTDAACTATVTEQPHLQVAAVTAVAPIAIDTGLGANGHDSSMSIELAAGGAVVALGIGLFVVALRRREV